MKKLVGEGWQFKVYRISKTRVLKKPTTHQQKLAKIEKSVEGDRRRLRHLIKDARAAKTMAQESLRLLKRTMDGRDASSLGNPIFLSAESYSQDYAMPLGKYFRRHSLRENKIAIQGYINVIFQAWRLGFSDLVFNFTINNGVKSGKVILLDLGELTFSKAKIRHWVLKKRWLTQWSYTSLQDETLKKYFKRSMNTNITPATLEKHWRVSLI